MPTSGVPIKCWASNIEQGALDQAINLANLPFTFKHVALMPDAHQGYGMPIGGVLATRGVVIPNAVGVDIGCGMGAVRTSLLTEDATPELLKRILSGARDMIPTGFKHHKHAQAWEGFNRPPSIEVIQGELDRAPKQLGTLGGGNHFIELQAGDDGYVWVMLHSGSRNFGFKTAKFYHSLAQELCAKWHVTLPDKDLAFLPLDTQEGQDYMTAMNYCLEFAAANRGLMMSTMLGIIHHQTLAIGTDEINIHHNYAALENHYGQNVMVHRKGATCVRWGIRGIIPGSMGTASYIVEGLGNPESFQSCSHGAGRRMGRKEACRSLSLEAEQAKMEGIIHGVRNQDDLDECPGAYKDIETVMADQEDLVRVLVKLRPLASLKG